MLPFFPLLSACGGHYVEPTTGSQKPAQVIDGTVLATSGQRYLSDIAITQINGKGTTKSCESDQVLDSYAITPGINEVAACVSIPWEHGVMTQEVSFQFTAYPEITYSLKGRGSSTSYKLWLEDPFGYKVDVVSVILRPA